MGQFKMGFNNGPICPMTGKRSYETHHEALLALRALAHRIKPFKSRIRHYLQSKKGPCDAWSCRHCNGWHLGRPQHRRRDEKTHEKREKVAEFPDFDENE